MKEPAIKKGDVRKDCSGKEYKVLEINNAYDEVEHYDWSGACEQFATEQRIVDFGLVVEDVSFCAVRAFEPDPVSGLDTYVFLIERNSTVLGE